MGKISSLFRSFSRHKYAYTFVAFAVYVGFFDENSLLRRWELRGQVEEVRSEIARYRQEYQETTRKLEGLRSDSVSIEQIARENYFMKKPDEDIFVFEEDLAR